MKKIALILIVFILAWAIYWNFLRQNRVDGIKSISTAGALKVGIHSLEFNASINNLMESYFLLKDAFVNTDSIAAKVLANKLFLQCDSIKISELKKDNSTIYSTVLAQISDVKSSSQSLAKQPNIAEMRKDFQSVTESLYPLLKTIHYEGKVVYLQNCPMAFGEGHDANWLSNTAEITNPYLGKKDITMYHCGETKDSIKAQ